MKRGALPPEVEEAARTISRPVWSQTYEPGRGPMHYAGGPYWSQQLYKLANKWEAWAEAARICAAWLGDGSFPAETPPTDSGSGGEGQ